MANAVHVVNRVLPYASHLFRLQMKACRIQRIQVKLDKYIYLRNFIKPGFHREQPIYIYIYREREIQIHIYNKSTMPENAEKYFYGPTGIRTHDLGNTA